MRNVILYIAASLDGYIADERGGVDWIQGDGSDPNNPNSFSEFIDTVDTVILGYQTYHQIVTELSPDSWVYPGKECFVLTHQNLKDNGAVKKARNSTALSHKEEIQRRLSKHLSLCLPSVEIEIT